MSRPPRRPDFRGSPSGANLKNHCHSLALLCMIGGEIEEAFFFALLHKGRPVNLDVSRFLIHSRKGHSCGETQQTFMWPHQA